MAEKTIVNYDELGKIGKTFEQESEAVAAIETQLRQKAQQLETEWIGEGANKFFNEFFQDILPAINRVKQACVMTSQTIRVVAQIFDEAEEETAGYFKDGSLEESGAGVGAGGGGATVDSSGINPSGMGPGLNNAPGGPVGTQPVQERVVVGEAPGGGSGIDVSEIDFGVEDMPGTGGGEEAGFKVETGAKPVPAGEEIGDKWMDEPVQEQMDYKEMSEQAATGAATGGGGGGSSAGSQGMQGNLEMGVGSTSQVSSGPGAAATGAGGGGGGMQDHVYQQAGGSSTPGTTAQSASQAPNMTSGGPAPAQQGGLRDAAGAAGALGGAGAAAGAGSAAAKKLKENKEGE